MGELEDLQAEVRSLKVNMAQVQQRTRDHAERFDTLQTPLWKRIIFRIDGWPGQTNLNADRPRWRPWRRWWRS